MAPLRCNLLVYVQTVYIVGDSVGYSNLQSAPVVNQRAQSKRTLNIYAFK